MLCLLSAVHVNADKLKTLPRVCSNQQHRLCNANVRQAAKKGCQSSKKSKNTASVTQQMFFCLCAGGEAYRHCQGCPIPFKSA